MACFYVDYFRSCLGGVGVHLPLFLFLFSLFGKGHAFLFYVEDDKVESSVRMCVFKFVNKDVYSSFTHSK